MPKPPLKKDNDYQKRKKRKYFRRRAAIEPIIGHLKSDHRAARNFLKGQVGDSINFMMAAAGFNYKKLMKKLKAKVLCLIFKIDTQIIIMVSKIIPSQIRLTRKAKCFFKARLVNVIF